MLKAGARKKLLAEIERAEAAFSIAARTFKAAVSLSDELETPAASALDNAMSDGWLSVIALVTDSSTLDAYETVRAALLAEIEAAFVSPARSIRAEEGRDDA